METLEEPNSGGWTKPLKHKPQAPVKPDSSQGNLEKNFDFTAINKDNIFSQPRALLEQLRHGPNNTNTTIDNKNENQNDVSKLITTTFTPNSNLDQTNQLNNFLSCLGFQMTQTDPQKPINPDPPIQISVRAREGVFLVHENEKDYLNEPTTLIAENGNIAAWSNDGNYLAAADLTGIHLIDMITSKRHSAKLQNIVALNFSTTGQYLVATDRRDKDKFMTSVYGTPLLTLIYEGDCQKFKKENWPYLKFSENDSLCFRQIKSTLVEVLACTNKFTPVKKIETKWAFDTYAISPKQENLMVAFVVPEKIIGYSKTESKVEVYKYDDLEKEPLFSKVIDKAHEILPIFSPTGNNVLFWAQTTHDETGKSYYGEHSLFYFNINKKEFKRVPTYKGPIHDVCWNPNGLEFIVISGFMPACSVLYDHQVVPKFEFGRHHRNTVKWSPLSRFICLAGFGNLSGEMEMWDVTTLTQVGTCKSNSAVSCAWSPDGRRLLTGVLNPRLRVDNKYNIFKYNGINLLTVDFTKTELYEVLWRPGKYIDRAPSPDHQKQVESQKKVDDRPRKLFQPKGTSTAFAAMLNREKNISGPRILLPNEKFDSDLNSPEISQSEEKKEEPKKKKRIRKKKDKEGGENDGEGEEKVQDG
jgi:translation initiation factor 2A